ncbi:hypothetical protein MANES_05G044865v8 [Manihot esculenta]|nr:hypothetical protein MANES_05G044865v8 [Manihot esculenta]
MQDEIPQTAVPSIKTPVGTPTKSISDGGEENGTPKLHPILVPTTPTTISAPMLMALTPATPYVSSAAKTAKKALERIEYSFEELRAGFIHHINKEFVAGFISPKHKGEPISLVYLGVK